MAHNFHHQENPLPSSNNRIADSKGQLMSPILPLVCGSEGNKATQI